MANMIPTGTEQIDVATLNAALQKGGIQGITPAASYGQAIQPATTATGEAWSAGQPLVQNPVTAQANSAKKSSGMQMDWGKFAQTLVEGDEAEASLPNNQMGTDMNKLYAQAREADRAKRAGNGMQHFTTAMSLYGGLFGSGGMLSDIGGGKGGLFNSGLGGKGGPGK